MTDAPPPPDTVLPCGCLLTCKVLDGEPELHLYPCRDGCRSIELVVDEATKTSTPVEYREDPL